MNDRKREILEKYKESILKARDLYLDTNKPENAKITYADEAIQLLNALDRPLDKDKIEKLFDDYEWITFEGRSVLAIHPEDIADALCEAYKNGELT